MRISWRHNQCVSWCLSIAALDPKQEEYGTFPSGSATQPSEVLSSGFGLIFCDSIKDKDGQAIDVDLMDLEGKTLFGIGPHAVSLGKVKATTWTSLYGKYAVIASVASLLILASDKLLQWLLPIFMADP